MIKSLFPGKPGKPTHDGLAERGSDASGIVIEARTIKPMTEKRAVALTPRPKRSPK